MFKYILILVAGIAIGYAYGFDDARTHEDHIVKRTIERVGGSNRGKYNNDVDKQMDNLEKRR